MVGDDNDQPDGGRGDDDLQTAAQMLLPGTKEIQRPGAAAGAVVGAIYAAVPGRDESLRFVDAVRSLYQLAVRRLPLARGIRKAAVLYHDDAEHAGLCHGSQAGHLAGSMRPGRRP